MFYLAGLKTQEEIREKILDIENDHRGLIKFANWVSKTTTDYINARWKEHSINIYTVIDKDLTIHVYIRDNTDDDNYFRMEDRSQGFKQFISILLSLSIDNTSGKIKDHIILLDEPEIHLHPSGVRWLRRELLEIGKNNYLFIATHSVFMLDRESKERHFLFSKGQDNLTKIQQIQTDDDINSDEILSQAFGINVLTDLISPYSLLVEGETDKEILRKALNKVHENHGIMISKGNGCNLPSAVSLLEFYDIEPVIVVDDDESGKKAKEEIIRNNKNNKKVFTIKELNSDIVDGGSIEDVLPLEYVIGKVNKILNMNKINSCGLNDKSPICKQLLLHLQREIHGGNSNKDKKAKINRIIDEIKIELSMYGEEISVNHSPKLFKLAEKILSVFGV